jgi:hypothetical protein
MLQASYDNPRLTNSVPNATGGEDGMGRSCGGGTVAEPEISRKPCCRGFAESSYSSHKEGNDSIDAPALPGSNVYLLGLSVGSPERSVVEDASDASDAKAGRRFRRV